MIIAISGLSLPDFLRNILFAIRLSQIDKILLVFRVDIFFGILDATGIGFEKKTFSGSTLRNGIEVETGKFSPAEH